MVTDERQNQILNLIGELSDHFNIDPPGVEFHRSLTYGYLACYVPWPWAATIKMSDKAANGDRWDSIVCHEFAHHLRRERQALEADILESRRRIRELKNQISKETKMLKTWDFGYREKVAKRPRRTPAKQNRPARKRHHDELFARCLWRVIEFHFGSVDRYQGFEYKGVGQLIATLDALKNLKTSS